MLPLLARFRRKPQARPLDEPSRRLDDFTSGIRAVPVVLSNGQAWMIPKPVLELRAGIDPSGWMTGFDEVPTYGDGAGKSFGTEYLDLIAGAARAFEEGDPARLLNITLKTSAFLLRQNYDLSDAEVGRLLPRLFGDEVNDVMWNEIMEVIGGVGGKPEAGTDASPSSSVPAINP